MPDAAVASWRLFFAIPMPLDDANRLADALAPYVAAYPAARWQRPDAFHVTVRFLGATPSDRVPALVEMARACAQTAVGFRMSTGSGDGLLRGRGSVAWCRIVDGERESSRISACLAGDRSDGTTNASPMPPHITVARRVDADLISALRSEALGRLGIDWTADRLVLYRSHTGTSAGSTYEVLAEMPL